MTVFAKRFGLLLFTAILVVNLIACDNGNKEGAAKYSIAIFKIIQHPAIDAMQDAFVNYLNQTPELKGQIQFKTFDAGGSSSEVSNLADLIVARDFALAFVLGTPCALALKEKTSTLPIVLGGATDPVATGLVASWNKPGRNMTGTTDLPPFDKHLEVLRRILPNAKRIGVIFNEKEANSVAAVSALNRAIKAGLSVVHLPIQTPQDLKAVIFGAYRKIDVLCIPTDNMLQANLPIVLAIAEDAQIPSFNCDRASVEKGALFSVAVEYADIGLVSAKMAKEILVNNLKPGDMAIRSLENPQVYINREVARKYGIKLPEDVSVWAEIL